MAAKSKEYHRLPGSGTRRVGFVSVGVARNKLYLGSDHLLSIDTIWFTETYKRFYFRDIQAFTLRKTNKGKIYNFILGACIFFTAGPAVMAFAEEPTAAIVLGSIAGFFLFFMILNMIWGPTCICQLKTSVQTEELPTLGRVPRAHKVLNRLRPLLAEAQGGELSPEQVVAQMAQPVAPADSGAPPIIAGDSTQPPVASF